MVYYGFRRDKQLYLRRQRARRTLLLVLALELVNDYVKGLLSLAPHTYLDAYTAWTSLIWAAYQGRTVLSKSMRRVLFLLDDNAYGGAVHKVLPLKSGDASHRKGQIPGSSSKGFNVPYVIDGESRVASRCLHLLVKPKQEDVSRGTGLRTSYNTL
ncbi:hypothetical protein FISHEDRAFT_57758 [Fistulina hepatica ATCC 64428]|uniref:Uncharacterized protein n=1 Tax=Fistulina hepatica ATCC 64428 TaxID=1128425 RepID=A0A0D7AFE7_9AGAR|nr:hypothetical protein FISHEDRAFT_57758 [Fistulina hepatica ATCC 64428]